MNLTYEYPKTSNLFARDPDTHQVITEPKSDFHQIATWHVTEKVDGTNIRLVFDNLDRERRHPVIRGRSDAANLPPDFAEEALPQFAVEEDLYLALGLALGLIQRPEEDVRYSMIVFGEGYGPGIQKGGGNYAPEKRFRAFDVATFKTTFHPDPVWSGTGNIRPFTVGPLWRRWSEVETVCQALGVETVPVISWFQRMDTNEIIRYVRGEPSSVVANLERGSEVGHIAEGVVARTDPYLYDSRGSRIRFKLKAKDLIQGGKS